MDLGAPSWLLALKLTVSLVFAIITSHLSLSMLAAFFGFAPGVSRCVLLLAGCSFGAFAIVSIAEACVVVAIAVYARVTSATKPNHDQV
jgi:hypothetical protein